MDKEKDWFSSMADRKITVVEIAKHLDVSRNTARSRLDEGLTSDEIIQLSRALHLNPVTALNELGKLESQEIFDCLDSDGTLLTTASPQQLIYQLAQDSLGYEEKSRLWKEVSDPRDSRDDLAARRAGTPVSGPHASLHDDDDGTVREFDYSPDEYAADSSPDETEERLNRGEDLID
ncbi:DNA-binding protein [Corynebacterium diphtheriae]|nr:DNA-binding protein [Corynebacterium diphtheriae]